MAKKQVKKIEPFEELSFLNLAEKDSPALIAVRIRGEIANSKRYEDNYLIKISDCGEEIRLHGNIKSPESRRNALHKFDTLIKVLKNSRDHIEKQLKENNLKF